MKTKYVLKGHSGQQLSGMTETGQTIMPGLPNVYDVLHALKPYLGERILVLCTAPERLVPYLLRAVRLLFHDFLPQIFLRRHRWIHGNKGSVLIRAGMVVF